MKKYFLIILFIPFYSFSQIQDCGTIPTEAQIDYLKRTSSARENWNSPESILYLPIQNHVVRQSNSTGGLTASDINFVMSQLNTYYANSSIQFYECSSTNYINNSTYYNFSSSQESVFCGANDISDVINIYYFNSVLSSTGSSLCGYAYFPPGPDRVIMKNSCATNGSTIVHELGHYLSLYHTHGPTNNGTTSELVNGSNCSTSGDDICDTPADPNLSGLVTSSCQYTGTSVDANGQAYVPDPTNIMSYSQKICRTFLSSGQYNRVNYSAINDRSYLNCVSNGYGCTDPNALNYNSSATIDDGSCNYSCSYQGLDEVIVNLYDTYGDGWNGNTISLDSLYFTLSSGYSGSFSACIDLSSCINVLYNPSSAQSWEYENSWDITDLSGNILLSGNNIGSGGDFGSGCNILGCTDVNAVNYNSSATIDDGTCMYAPLSSSVIISAVSCAGKADGAIDVTVSGGVLPFVYSWNNGMTTEDISGISGGNYDLTISDAQSQTLTTTYIVNEDLPLNLSYSITNATTNTSTDGAIDLTVIGGLAPYVYFWNTSPTQASEDLSGLLAGDYIVYVGYNNWICFVADTVTVNVIVSGCTDPLAINYDPTAIVDDGSCTYFPIQCSISSPTGAYISELIHDRARINWDNMNDANCMVNQYRIRYREIGSSSWSSKTMSGSGLCMFGLNTTSKKILGLSPSTTYEYYMKAWYCGGGVSSWSAIQNFTTLDECDNVINFTVSTPTNTKASFTWDSTSAYSFARIKLRPDITGSSWITAGGFGVMYPALNKSKNGLTPGQTYRASARTWCDPSGGAYRSAGWTSPIFWTQPTSIRLEGGTAINNLDVYPNPSRDIFNVSFTSEDAQDLKVRVLNLIGEELINENLQQFIGEYSKQINLGDNAKGIYFLEIVKSDGIINKKLIVQ